MHTQQFATCLCVMHVILKCQAETYQVHARSSDLRGTAKRCTVLRHASAAHHSHRLHFVHHEEGDEELVVVSETASDLYDFVTDGWPMQTGIGCQCRVSARCLANTSLAWEG